eukprot:6213410-Pleurochrysis_carterae.AAC.3
MPDSSSNLSEAALYASVTPMKHASVITRQVLKLTPSIADAGSINVEFVLPKTSCIETTDAWHLLAARIPHALAFLHRFRCALRLAFLEGLRTRHNLHLRRASRGEGIHRKARVFNYFSCCTRYANAKERWRKQESDSVTLLRFPSRSLLLRTRTRTCSSSSPCPCPQHLQCVAAAAPIPALAQEQAEQLAVLPSEYEFPVSQPCRPLSAMPRMAAPASGPPAASPSPQPSSFSSGLAEIVDREKPCPYCA